MYTSILAMFCIYAVNTWIYILTLHPGGKPRICPAKCGLKVTEGVAFGEVRVPEIVQHFSAPKFEEAVSGEEVVIVDW